jgi:poly(3-hydroxybutyrate) depolymerase
VLVQLTRRLRTPSALVAALALLAWGCEADDGAPTDAPQPAERDEATDGDDEPASQEPSEDDGEAEVETTRLEGITTALAYAEFVEDGLDRWEQEVPAVEQAAVTSTADGEEQPLLWLPPGDADEPQPLLVVLHSWSTGYTQHQSIPYAMWAEQHGWAAVFPEFRGTFDRPEATGSDLAVQDVLDAIDLALEHDGVDPDRVFVTGFSGGGMMTLLVAGRHPDRFAGAAAWVPVHDLVEWFAFNVEEQGDDVTYPEEIRASCGGDPLTDEDARAECEHRSPVTHLDGIRDAGLPVYLGHGLDDDIVRPDASLQVFDLLVDDEHAYGAEAHEAAFGNRLPDALQGEVAAETHFADEDPEVLHARGTDRVTLVIFDGEHDVAYHPALEWMAQLAAR